MNKLSFKVYAMEKGEFGEKEELLQRLSKSERECIKLSEEVARLGDAERRYQVRIQGSAKRWSPGCVNAAGKSWQ